MCALFGLVHGAGFARALDDAGLPGSDLFVGLASFNVGLEVAQLALVLAAIAVFRVRRAERLAAPLAILIGGAGAWLFVDRALAIVAAR